MIDFIPTLQLTPDSWHWQLYLLAGLLFVPLTGTMDGETVTYWLCFGIGRRG